MSQVSLGRPEFAADFSGGCDGFCDGFFGPEGRILRRILWRIFFVLCFPMARDAIGKIQRVKTQRAKTSENFAEEKKLFTEDISEDFSDLTFAGFYSISGYLRTLRGRLLSSEKFSEVFALWVFTLKPFRAQFCPMALVGELAKCDQKMTLKLGEKRQKGQIVPISRGHPCP